MEKVNFEQEDNNFKRDKAETIIRISIIHAFVLFVSLLAWFLVSLIPVSAIYSEDYFKLIIITKCLSITCIIVTFVFFAIFISKVIKRHNEFFFDVKKYVKRYLLVLLIVNLSVLSIAFITREKERFYLEFNSEARITNGYENYYPYSDEFYNFNTGYYPGIDYSYDEDIILGNKYIYLGNSGSDQEVELDYIVEFTDSFLLNLNTYSSEQANTKDGINYIIKNANNYYGDGAITIFLWKGCKSCRYTYINRCAEKNEVYEEHVKTDDDLLNDAIRIFDLCS